MYIDNPNDWKPYKKQGSPINTKATGGHSDALDWDRHLGHVSIIYGRPSWMYNQSHPADVRLWPRGELYFETRYVWTHSEFTPQQTMRGKMALYGYLYARKN